ncbi:uncharacterized protein L969DRAFT_84390 [Mixia osmundae IAM 14324]|uniref:Cytochrome c oxidase subunit 6, mitochondrial n=1 Tax=Mixia osmundae (strain CBS 9802 / IAM 14324 / JCM 22182 / KY 12970) TaxID=764103 RepID=G7E304_MIXOS|nr:uncharacterized protein L969DRAFT_84390 [Mixia osmundae IAM 14324]KEI42526.1 hypothetical protein L969DRAFT_84390 [Mixia osmundae IAM 14324]GAA97185.1 hypothetical protein E5Q_03861 [Mixia osmundae IAM 14324]
MASSALTGMFRSAVRPSTSALARQARFSPAAIARGARHYSEHAEEESYEAFNARYAKFFTQVEDVFELQRGLNNCFAYDLVPSQEVVEEALKASRRVNDYGTAVRIFEGIAQKVENTAQYNEYLKETEPLRKELGILTKEELYNLPGSRP